MTEMKPTCHLISRKLPFDVYTCLIDAVAGLKDGDTVKSFSLVCKDFRPLCAKKIFSAIKLNNMPRIADRLHQLKIIMERNPAFGTYTRRIDVCLSPRGQPSPDLPIVLAQFLNVEVLVLNGYLGSSWNEIPDPLRTSLERLISSSCLISLHLYCQMVIDFPIPWILATSASLKDLDIRYPVKPSNELRPIIVRLNAPVPSLRYFHIDITTFPEAAHLLLESKRPDGLPIINFSTVETLSLRVCAEAFEPTNQFFGIVTNIKNLIIEVNPQTSNWPNGNFRFFDSAYISPSSVMTLQHLKFNYQVFDEYGDPYSGAINELTTLASCNCPLQGVALEILIGSDTKCTTDPEVWKTVEEVITLSKFPALRHVSIHIESLYGIIPTDEEFMEQLSGLRQHAFQTLSNEPRIEFSFTVHETSMMMM